MSRIILTIILLLFLSPTVFAHDGSEHTSDLEILIAGIGLFFIIATCIYNLWWNHKHPDELIEYDNFGVQSDIDSKK
ncbi:MAG: hypothetical protein Phog2KO_49620 [Phototrophicaceae bacterium]